MKFVFNLYIVPGEVRPTYACRTIFLRLFTNLYLVVSGLR
jgi:hypothetical protein